MTEFRDNSKLIASEYVEIGAASGEIGKGQRNVLLGNDPCLRCCGNRFIGAASPGGGEVLTQKTPMYPVTVLAD